MNQNVSLSKLAEAVNLSEDTLNTYVSCGILRGEATDGEVFFSLSEIQTIFGNLAIDRITSAASAATPALETEQPVSTQSTEVEKTEPEAVEAAAPVAEPEPLTAEKVENEAEAVVEPTLQSSTPLPSAELLSVAASLRDQIEQLRHERDWLRSRVERLEARSERDQMLILSQSENVRKLIVTPQKRSWAALLPWNKE